jgi:hypothetical protein
MDLTATTLEAEFRARLAPVEAVGVAGLVGIEQEYTVRTRDAGPVDFRDVLPALTDLAPPLDPDDPRARRTPSGLVLTADGHEAEAAAPPVEVRPGFADDVGAWSRAARVELATRLGDEYALQGYSTHINVAVDNLRNARLGALFTRTFAPGFMLLVDRAASPGLIIRPRPGRVELCGEFVDGPWMRAAAVYATGAVLACDDALTGKSPFAALPPQLAATTRPARARAGWFVDRAAFGSDLLTADARRTRLRRCDGGRVRAQHHFESAWTAARAALQGRASATDLAVVDDLVAGRTPLPTEIAPEVIDIGDAGPLPAPSPLGDIGRVRVRPGFTAEASAATWSTTVFCLRARGRVREAYAAIPRDRLGDFFTALDAGHLDDVLERYLALAPTDRPVAMTPNQPGLGDVAPGAAQVTDAATADRLAELVGGNWRRAEKLHLHITTSTTGGDGGSIVVVPTGRGCLVSPAIRWTAAITAVAVLLVGVLAYFLTKDGDEPEPDRSSSSASVPRVGPPECGSNTDDVLLSFSELVKDCQYTQDQLRGGLVYRFDRTPFNAVTIDLGTGIGEPVVGGTCKNHNATPQQLQAGADPDTGFIGLSLLGVSVAGMKPDGLVRIQVRAPNGVVRAGNGRVDKTGYAEVQIPINIPGPHTVISATYYPDGNPNGTGIPIDISKITNGIIDGSFPTTQCDKAATLDLVPKPAVNREQSDAAKDAVLDSASLWPLYRAIAGPGMDVDLSGPYTVRLDDGRYAITGGGGLTIPIDPVKGAGGDRRGKPPTSVYFHTGSIAGSGSTGAGDAWGEVLPCGPGNLALTVCTNAAPPLRDGTYGTVAAIFDEPIPLAGDQDVDYTFDVAGKQHRLRYDADADGIEGWTLTGGDPGARAMIRNNVVMLLVPLDSPTDATYQISTSTNGTRDKQPRDPAPLRGTITVAAVPGVETPQQFLDAFSAAVTNRDGAFLANRLHPAVITRYGKAACDTYTSGGLTPVQFVVTNVKPPTTYEWTTDGQTTNVPDTNEVAVRQTAGGTTQERVIHIAFIDHLWRWFTDCTPT